MVRQHRTTAAIMITVALTASLATTAMADPAPLAGAKATIAQARGSALVQPNPDEQTASAAISYSGPCSEVCSAAGYGYGPANALTRSPATPVSCGDACSGHGYGPVTAPALVVRVATPGGGFDWGDAGIGAGGVLALTMLGLGGVLVVSRRRGGPAPTGHGASVQS